MRKNFISIVLAFSLSLIGCNDTKGGRELIDIDIPNRGPVFQFGTPMTFGALPGEALGLAVGNFDGDARSDVATFLDTDPLAPLAGGTIFVQQGSVDTSLPLRLDITGGAALSRLKTLYTTPSGDLLGVGSGLVADLVGAVRFLPPLASGVAIPLGNNRQTMAPFADDIPKNATISACTVAGQSTFAIPGQWDGSGSGVLFLDTVALEPVGGPTGFLSTTTEGILLPSAVCQGDFNNDGRDDLVVVGDGTAVLYLQAANGTFTASDSIAANDVVKDICCGQMDSDAAQRPDLVIITEAEIFVYLNGDFSAPAFGRPLLDGEEINCGDLNNDGFNDIFGVVGLNEDERVYVSLGAGTGAFLRLAEARVGDDASTRLRNVRPAELSGDGEIDLVLLKSGDTESEIVWIPQL